MKITFISDTHSKHEYVEIEPCDILIHCGDATRRGHEIDVRNFAEWFSEQPAKHKIYIPGNHEKAFEQDLPLSKTWFYEECPKGILLLHESVEVEGIKIFGSPYSPWFHSWAFNVNRGTDIANKWNEIPLDVQILVTHGPPHGILDVCSDHRGGFESVGCEELSKLIPSFQNLKIHAFGHIHEGSGILIKDNVTYVNASICNGSYHAINPPRTINYDHQIKSS